MLLTVLLLSLTLDGQAIATKLSKKITKTTNSIKVAVDKYNAALASWKDRVEGLPEEIEFDKVKDPESHVFLDFRKDRPLNKDEVPFAVKRTVIDLHHFTKRCKEEIHYLDIEMLRLVKHHENRKAYFQKFIHENTDETALHVRGLKCILQKRIREQENKLYVLGSLFCDHLPVEIQPSIPKTEYKFDSIMTCRDFNIEMLEGYEEHEVIETDDEEELSSILGISGDEEANIIDQ